MPSHDRGVDGSQPPLSYPDYVSNRRRCPSQPLVQVPWTLSDVTVPVFGHSLVGDGDNDLTRQHAAEPQGQRIVVAGRVCDEDGRPVAGALVEAWQANAAPQGAIDTVPTTIPRRSTRISLVPAAPSPTRRADISSRPSSPVRIRGAITTTPGGRPTSISRCSVRCFARDS
jgi:hypothetical protein